MTSDHTNTSTVVDAQNLISEARDLTRLASLAAASAVGNDEYKKDAFETLFNEVEKKLRAAQRTLDEYLDSQPALLVAAE